MVLVEHLLIATRVFNSIKIAHFSSWLLCDNVSVAAQHSRFPDNDGQGFDIDRAVFTAVANGKRPKIDTGRTAASTQQ